MVLLRLDVSRWPAVHLGHYHGHVWNYSSKEDTMHRLEAGMVNDFKCVTICDVECDEPARVAPSDDRG